MLKKWFRHKRVVMWKLSSCYIKHLSYLFVWPTINTIKIYNINWMNHQLVPAFRVAVIESVIILFISIHLNAMLHNDKRFFKCIIILCDPLLPDYLIKCVNSELPKIILISVKCTLTPWNGTCETIQPASTCSKLTIVSFWYLYC